MGYAEMERDLAFIKRTMEAATRYDNIPPIGYVVTGLLGMIGTGITYALLGENEVARIGELSHDQILPLGLTWGGVLLAAVFSLVIASILHARGRGVTAWNSLATRMFMSQIPQALVAGLLTIGLVHFDRIGLIPAVWLLHYGVITYSFSYFAGRDHQVIGTIFIGMGTTAMFGPQAWVVPLLGAGFGLLHIAMGINRMLRKKRHEA